MVAQTAIAAGPRQPDPQVTEREARSLSGLRMLVLGIATSIFALAGLTPVVPGRARVVQLFGRYRGTIRDSGLQWVNPFTRRIAVSTRIRNQESAQAKVNDADGNPIEIAAVVVWQVADTACFVWSRPGSTATPAAGPAPAFWLVLAVLNLTVGYQDVLVARHQAASGA